MENFSFDLKKQHFRLKSTELYIPDYPLTVTLQITRKCNLKCIYCSESEYIPDPPLNKIFKMIKNLKGVPRIIVSGGEPTLRSDLIPILKECKKNFDIVALASNCTQFNEEQFDYLDYIDVTIDGPRKIHNRIRGSYEDIINGIWKLKEYNQEFSIVMVILEQNKNYLPYIAHMADSIGANKLKILCPIPKGRGKKVIQNKISSKEIISIAKDLKIKKEEFGWKIHISLTNWERIGEGHAILIHPNGDLVASPVWTKENCLDYIGNILNESIKELWLNYPYKTNHVNKYIEKTLIII